MKTMLFSLIIFLSVTVYAGFSEAERTVWQENFKNILTLHQKIDQTTGLEVWVAGQGSSLESNFGHAQVRFVGSGATEALDLVVSFEALIDTDDFKNWKQIKGYYKGLTGSYRIIPSVKKLSDLWKTYSFKEDRPIHRILISSNSNLRKALIEKLIQWVKNAETEEGNPLQQYYVLTQNCVTLLMRLFEEAGFAYAGALGSGSKNEKFPENFQSDTVNPGFVAPIDSHYIFRQELLNPFLPIEIPSFKSKVEKALLEFNINIDEFKKGKWPSNAAERLLRLNLPWTTVYQIFLNINLPSNIRETLLSSITGQRKVREVPSAEELIDLRPLPRDLYLLCSTQECGLKVREASRQVWQWQKKVSWANREEEIVRDDEWRMAFSERLEALQKYFERYQRNHLLEQARTRPHYQHWNILLGI